MLHKVMKALKMLPARVFPKTFKELEVYPERPERDDDAEYHRAHKQLVEVEHLPCFWCDITLEEAQKAGYTLETHHWFEQSLWDGDVDPEKAIRDLRKLDFHDHAKDLPTDPALMTANHIANLVVSCSVCHREDGYGLHGATIPFVWIRRVLKPGSDVLQRWKPLGHKLKGKNHGKLVKHP